MNLELPKKERVPKTRIVIYIAVLVICIIAITVIISVQVLGDDIVNGAFGIDKITKRTEQEEATLKANFKNIFDNQVEDNGNYSIQKINQNEEIIYTCYDKEEKTDQYEINIKLPYINIKNAEVQNFNQEILDTFEEKSEEILENTDIDTSTSIIYTVKYKAYIENNILSLVLYSDLKQDTSAQRVIFQTFNFDLENEKELTLSEVISIYDLNENDVQNEINENIEAEQKEADDLKELGYNVFSRDLNSDIYKIENITEYFVYDNNIYIIFAYGNDSITSEMDLVII